MESSTDANGMDVQAALAALRELATALDAVDESAARHLGIGRSDLRILDALSRHGGAMRPAALADEIGLSRPASSAALSRLERRDLVERSADPADRRSVRVTLTTHATASLVPVFRQVRAAADEILAELPATELAVVRDVASRLAGTLGDLARAADQPH